MTLDRVLALQAAGAQVLDTRDPVEFAAAHLAGSINIGLGGQYATWAGTMLNREHPIVIIADPDANTKPPSVWAASDSITSSATWKTACAASSRALTLTSHTTRLSAVLASEILIHTEPPLLIDVRTHTNTIRNTSTVV